MKDNFIHVCFVIDESGSMSSSIDDVIGGFKSVIEEQRKNENGTVAISYFKFNTYVTEVYKGVSINDVKPLERYNYYTSFSTFMNDDKTVKGIEFEEYDPKKHYSPNGMTALYDGVGVAIDKIGEWLSDMDESERPEKNLIVIMTDGGENASSDYSARKVKEMIEHQEKKYNWTFLYMGSDITNAEDANLMGVKTRCFSSKANYSKNYDIVNTVVTSYLNSEGSYETKSNELCEALNFYCDTATNDYANELSIDVSSLKAATDN